ncbi:MAG: 30S ribosomal protein S6 [Planctomycetes bacterium]|nr:30S ribosomal protein S6 [Planctomycetota bacterium]
MRVNTYECMFLLDTNKVAGDVGAAAQQLHTILEKNQAEVLASRQWDERRLAYPVKGHKKGLYYLTYFRTDGKNLVNIERDCALNEMILRALVIKIDPKIQETMLAVARDEHAFALQMAAEEPAEEGGTPAGVEGIEEGRPARRPRRHPEEVGKE